MGAEITQKGRGRGGGGEGDGTDFFRIWRTFGKAKRRKEKEGEKKTLPGSGEGFRTDRKDDDPDPDHPPHPNPRLRSLWRFNRCRLSEQYSKARIFRSKQLDISLFFNISVVLDFYNLKIRTLQISDQYRRKKVRLSQYFNISQWNSEKCFQSTEVPHPIRFSSSVRLLDLSLSLHRCL